MGTFLQFQRVLPNYFYSSRRRANDPGEETAPAIYILLIRGIRDFVGTLKAALRCLFSSRSGRKLNLNISSLEQWCTTEELTPQMGQAYLQSWKGLKSQPRHKAAGSREDRLPLLKTALNKTLPQENSFSYSLSQLAVGSRLLFLGDLLQLWNMGKGEEPMTFNAVFMNRRRLW